MIIRVVDGTEREIVVRCTYPGQWMAHCARPRSYGYGTTAADAISDLFQVLENGDE
jgi:hypothetical protein